jgi:CBS-domain-containing membrane protein
MPHVRPSPPGYRWWRRASFTSGEALDLMNQHDINHLPLVDAENRVVEFLLRKDLVPDVRLELSAVIMAGGYGKRLLPLTENVPNPCCR